MQDGCFPSLINVAFLMEKNNTDEKVTFSLWTLTRFSLLLLLLLLLLSMMLLYARLELTVKNPSPPAS